MKFLIGILASAAASALSAEQMQGQNMATMNMSTGQPALRESGQSAFAAITEAVRALEADPHTNWAKANIDALRNHLVDMDNVTTGSDVVTKPVPGGAQFQITSGNPRVVESISRMVRLHSGMASQESSYKIAVQAIPGGAAETVTGSSAADETKIRALGFFGLLTEGNHHQRHHIALARGEPMHHK